MEPKNILTTDSDRYPCDETKVWSHRDYPLNTIGRIVLNRNPENYFAEVEQAAFNPAHFVPGIGPSPDKMLQGRLFSYGDTQRYRLGANHMYGDQVAKVVERSRNQR